MKIIWCATMSRCNTLHYTATDILNPRRCFAIRGAGRHHYNTLQHTAAHCNQLQHACSTLQHTAKHCNTLQHTATHCNTLQHTATNLLSRPGWFEGEYAAQVFLAPAIDGHKCLCGIMDDLQIWVVNYGVATISRLLRIIGLFGRIKSFL